MEKGLHEILIFNSLALVGLENSNGVSNLFEQVGKGHIEGLADYGLVDEMYKSIAKYLPAQSRRKATTGGLSMAKSWANTISKAKDGVEEVTKSDEYDKLMSIRAKISSRFTLRRTLVTRDHWGEKMFGIEGNFLRFFKSCRNNGFATIVDDAAQRCKAVLISEGWTEQVANEVVISNRAEMQAIAAYPYLATLKARKYKKKRSKRTT